MGNRPTLLRQREVVPKGKSTDLAVLLHSYRGASDLKDLCSAVNQVLPDADTWMPDYAGHPFSNDNSFNLAAQLNDGLDDLYTKSRSKGRSGYERIYLIGHGIGALLARKAFVYGHGITDDHPLRHSQTKKQWVQVVDRIVLLAGMNRGWTLSPKPSHMPFGIKLEYMIAATIARLTGTGKFLLSAERGAPFLANLRLQWLELVRRITNLPPVFQLLGDHDNIVSNEDNSDLETSADFIFVPVHGTGHSSIKDFDSSVVGQQRRETFCSTLINTSHELRTQHGSHFLRQDYGVDHAVIALHGMRDFGNWTERMVKRFKAFKIPGTNSSYGFFPLLPFLLYRDRQKNVRWFVDVFTELQAEYPNARISVIGHSNGTYIVARALELYKMVKFHHVALAGSVIRRDFDWNAILNENRVSKLRNDMAAGDWVVGVGPGFYELLGKHSHWSRLDIGTGGFRGFLDSRFNRIHQNGFLDGGHSVAVSSDANQESLAKFILTGENDLSGLPPLLKKVSWWADLLSRCSWLIFPILVFIVVGLGFVLHLWLAHLGFHAAIAWGVSLIVLWLLLNTI